MRIIGVDPGLRYSGFGIIVTEHHKTMLLDVGYLALSSSDTVPKRIELFYDFFISKIIAFEVTDLALETPFLGKNAQNFLKLGYLRGILYLLAQKNNIVLHEYSPREVKQALTGWGSASKEQVARVVLRLFPRLEPPKRDDVTDALAVGLCGMWKKGIKEYYEQ